jgi:hypothetical protein
MTGKEQCQRLDEVLEMLEKSAKRMQEDVDNSKKHASTQMATYENVLKSKDSSETQKAKAIFGKMLEYERLERLSSQLSLLYILQIFAFKVKILQISVDNIREQVAKSGLLEKTKDIEDIKKNIETLAVLLEAQHELISKIGEDRSRDLSYVS